MIHEKHTIGTKFGDIGCLYTHTRVGEVEGSDLVNKLLRFSGFESLHCMH